MRNLFETVAGVLALTGFAPVAAAWALGEALSPLPEWLACALLFAGFVAVAWKLVAACLE